MISNKIDLESIMISSVWVSVSKKKKEVICMVFPKVGFGWGFPLFHLLLVVSVSFVVILVICVCAHITFISACLTVASRCLFDFMARHFIECVV